MAHLWACAGKCPCQICPFHSIGIIISWFDVYCGKVCYHYENCFEAHSILVFVSLFSVSPCHVIVCSMAQYLGFVVVFLPHLEDSLICLRFRQRLPHKKSTRNEDCFFSMVAAGSLDSHWRKRQYSWMAHSLILLEVVTDTVHGIPNLLLFLVSIVLPLNCE